MTTYQCSICGEISEGRANDLYEHGWRVRYSRAQGRIVRRIGCPEHANKIALEAVE